MEKQASTKTIPVHCSLAPSFGQLGATGATKEMDNQLQKIIGASVIAISKLVQQAKDQNRNFEWKEVEQVVSLNPLLQPCGALVQKEDTFVKGDLNYFKYDGDANINIMREVHTWFVKCIGDEDILTHSPIDIHTLGMLVGHSGGSILDSPSSIFKKTCMDDEAMDVGILCYPDVENPYFKVYKIKVAALTNCQRVLFAQNCTNSITCHFSCRKYKPNASKFVSKAAEIKQMAIKEAAALFM